jgi:hypothetical protein
MASVAAILNELRQIIEYDAGAGGGYRHYHRSVADFLLSPAYKSGDQLMANRYHIGTAWEHHERIARYYLDKLRRRTTWPSIVDG